MEKQVSGHDGIFPTILRELLEHHPKTGEKTTLRDLGKAVGTRQQTISLYKNGETQPTPETLARIAGFFGVSVDYLLTGVSSENKGFNEELGLSEEAVNMLKLAKSIPRETDDSPSVSTNSLRMPSTKFILSIIWTRAMSQKTSMSRNITYGIYKSMWKSSSCARWSSTA